MASLANTQELVSGGLAELLVRELSQTGYGGTTSAPALSADSKFARFTLTPPQSPSSPTAILAGLFLTGDQTPFAATPSGYWTNSPRRLWLMHFDRKTVGEPKTDVTSSTISLAGSLLADPATGRAYRALSRKYHWVPVQSSAPSGSFPAAIATAVDVVEIHDVPADYGYFATQSPRDRLGNALRAARASIFGTARPAYVDDLSARNAIPLLRRGGQLNVGVTTPEKLAYSPASCVVADAGAFGRQRADLPSGPAIATARMDFSISVVSSRYSEPESQAVARVAAAAAGVERWLAGLSRELTRRDSASSLTGLSVVADQAPSAVEGDCDTWSSRIQVSATWPERL